MSNCPLITIAVPTLNRASWLKGCLEAAFAQSYRNLEVVVSDNASTDNTRDVLAGFSDPRLRVTRQQTKLGPIANWNSCLSIARGEYIVFVPDDDGIAPWFLERCVALLRENADLPVVIALGNVYLASENRTIYPPKQKTRLETGIWDGSDILKDFLEGRFSATICTIVFRTEALRAQGGFPEGWPHAGDIASWTPLLLIGKSGFVREICGTYCVHAETQSSNFEFNILLTDLKKLSVLLSDRAETCVADLRTRREIQFLAKRYFARVATHVICASRKSGAKLTDMLPVILKWRGDLRHIAPADLLNSFRGIALLLLPSPITRGIRRLVHFGRRFEPGNPDQRRFGFCGHLALDTESQSSVTRSSHTSRHHE